MTRIPHVCFPAPLALLGALLLLWGASAGSAEPPAAPEAAPELTEEQALAARLEELFEVRDRHLERLETATGEDREALEEQEWQRQLDSHEVAVELTLALLEEPEGPDAERFLPRIRDMWQRNRRGYPRLIEQHERDAARLRERRAGVADAERLGLEQEITEEEARIQRLYAAAFEGLAVMESLGLKIERTRAVTLERLQERADTQAGRVRLASADRADLLAQRREAGDSAELTSQLAFVAERLEREASNLQASIKLLEAREIDAADYQQLLIESTGEITVDVLDAEIAAGLLERWIERLSTTVSERGPQWVTRLLLFVLVLLVFRLLASLTRRLVQRSVRSSRVSVSQLLEQTLVAWPSRFVMLVGILVALSQLGVEIGPLLAGLGIAGFVIGFALQDSLANFAAGAMILVYRPFDVGDIIEAAGVMGEVRDMSLVSTTVHTFDNQTLIVPNTRLWGDVIRNVTAQRTRRVDLVFRIGFEEDVDRVAALLREVVEKDDRVLAEPRPMVEVHRLTESAVEFIVRPWVVTRDYWPVYWALQRAVKKRLDAEGIRIPFPQQDVHHHFQRSDDGHSGPPAPAG